MGALERASCSAREAASVGLSVDAVETHSSREVALADVTPISAAKVQTRKLQLNAVMSTPDMYEDEIAIAISGTTGDVDVGLPVLSSDQVGAHL